MSEVGDRYAAVRGRITSLVSAAGEDGAATTIPTCPEWTVKDLVSHLTGVCADIIGGRLEGAGTDEWTQRQVDERRDRSISEVLAEWSEVAPQCEAIAEAFGEAGHQLAMDVTAHEHDIRTALNQPGERDNEALDAAVGWFSRVLGQEFQPAFRIVTPEGVDFVFGGGDPQTTVKVSSFDIFRALTGRRSEDQIAAFGWEDDYKPYLGAFNLGPFTVSPSPVIE